MNDLEALGLLDPARDTEPTAMQWARSRAFIDRTIEGPRPRRGRARGLLAAGALAVALAVVAVVAAVPRTPETAPAAWTAVPTAPTGDRVALVARECVAMFVDGGVPAYEILMAEQRGPGTTLILRTSDGYTLDCEKTAGFRVGGWVLRRPGEPPLPVPPAAVVKVDSTATVGDAPDTMSEVLGTAGPRVTAIEVRVAGGPAVQATVANGWWAASWPGGETERITVVVRADGRTASYPIAALG